MNDTKLHEYRYELFNAYRDNNTNYIYWNENRSFEEYRNNKPLKGTHYFNTTIQNDMRTFNETTTLADAYWYDYRPSPHIPLPQ